MRFAREHKAARKETALCRFLSRRRFLMVFALETFAVWGALAGNYMAAIISSAIFTLFMV